MIPSFLMLNYLGLINHLSALIVPSVVSAFGIFLMQQFMVSIPESYLDSGRIDGASEFRVFWQIVLPMSKPAMATLGMLTFMWNWNSYLWPMIVLKSNEIRTLPIILYWFSTHNSFKLEMTYAATILVVFPILIVFLFTQKWIIRGLTLTGIK